MRPEDFADKARSIARPRGAGSGTAALTKAREFVRYALGERSDFYKQLLEFDPDWNDDYLGRRLRPLMESVAEAITEGWIGTTSLRRQAEMDVVSDFLEQADTLLNDTRTHPAAAAVLIGASLEEFLRNWIEEARLDLKGQKPSLNTYASALRAEDLLTKQDLKDVTSWGGIRNSAAHGEWEQASDRDRVRLMLEGVNLFMRRYGQR